MLPTFEDAKSTINKIGNHLLHHLATEDNPCPFKLTGVVEENYRTIYHYFERNPKFNAPGRSFQKGLLVYGNVGTSKTLMMKIYSMMLRNHKKRQYFEIMDADSIVREFLIEKGGFEVIERYSRKHHFSDRDPKGLCIDDLGMEDTKAKSYGNEANVIADILFARYNQMMDRGMLTYATSNLPPVKLGALYGERVADRMIEMFNMIHFKGESLRK